MPRERKIVFTKEQEADIVAMYKAGLPWREIQARHNIHSPSTVKRVLMDNGVDVSVGGKPTAKGKKCECGHIAPVGSKYCNMCGKLLQSEEEKSLRIC